MRDTKKYKLSYDETRIIIISLIELRNNDVIQCKRQYSIDTGTIENKYRIEDTSY